jgi:hypothetical protein
MLDEAVIDGKKIPAVWKGHDKAASIFLNGRHLADGPEIILDVLETSEQKALRKPLF